jgi:hypothetical protein
MKLLVGTGTLVSTAELGEAIGADNETVKNWIRRGIIRRAPIGGRQLRNRLFSTDEVYKAALKNELVELGIPPSPASEAINALWKAWDKKDTPDGWNIYALVVPTKGKWTAALCSRKVLGGPLYQGTGSARFQMELPKHAFAVIPISDVFERVGRKTLALLGG